MNIKRTILFGIINGFILHIIMSVLWFFGFGFGMLAFSADPGAGLAKPIFIIHGIFYFPISFSEYKGIHMGPYDVSIKEDYITTLEYGSIGPIPSIATIIWCIIIGLFLYVFVRYLKHLFGATQLQQDDANI